MSLKTYCYKCPHHGVFAATVEFDDRDRPRICGECGERSPRTWEQAGPRVMRNTYIDGTRRFDNLRADMKLRKARSEAKETGDWQTVNEIRQERQRRNES